MDSSDAPGVKEYVPATHGVQAETFAWPVSVLYNPAKQVLQREEAAAPISFPYIPAAVVNKVVNKMSV